MHRLLRARTPRPAQHEQRLHGRRHPRQAQEPRQAQRRAAARPAAVRHRHHRRVRLQGGSGGEDQKWRFGSPRQVSGDVLFQYLYHN